MSTTRRGLVIIRQCTHVNIFILLAVLSCVLAPTHIAADGANTTTTTLTTATKNIATPPLAPSSATPAAGVASGQDDLATKAGLETLTSVATSSKNNDNSRKKTSSSSSDTVTYLPGSGASVVLSENKSTNNLSANENKDAKSKGNDSTDALLEDEGEEKENDDTPRFTMETFVTIAVTVAVVLANCTIIMVAAWTEAFHNFNKVFLYSMATADLLIGLCVLPYSIFLSVFRHWVFASGIFCNIEAYVLLTLHGAKLFSLTWLNVDHYIAVRKPERYNVMMSRTRSVCWIIISWMAAVCFFMPPMLSLESSFFNPAIFLCQADTAEQMAYILTSTVLVSMPALFALSFTNIYLFTKSYKKRIRFYEKIFVELSTRPLNYHTTFVMCLMQVLVWIPYTMFYVVKTSLSAQVDYRAEFYLCWLGLTCSFTNCLVLMVMSPGFRQATRDMYSLCDWCPSWCCCCCCCRRTPQHHYSSDVNVITLTRKR